MSSVTAKGVYSSLESDTILDRLTSQNPEGSFSPIQSEVDQLVSHAAETVADGKMMASLFAAGLAGRFVRLGALGIPSPIPQMLPAFSHVASLAAESAVFAGMERKFQKWEGAAPVLPFHKAWVGAGINLGFLKLMGQFGKAQNFITQHLFIDVGLVTGQHAGFAAGIMEKPQGSLAQQMIRAEALNLGMKGSLALLQGVSPTSHALEKSLNILLPASRAPLFAEMARNIPSNLQPAYPMGRVSESRPEGNLSSLSPWAVRMSNKGEKDAHWVSKIFRQIFGEKPEEQVEGKKALTAYRSSAQSELERLQSLREYLPNSGWFERPARYKEYGKILRTLSEEHAELEIKRMIEELQRRPNDFALSLFKFSLSAGLRVKSLKQPAEWIRNRIGDTRPSFAVLQAYEFLARGLLENSPEIRAGAFWINEILHYQALTAQCVKIYKILLSNLQPNHPWGPEIYRALLLKINQSKYGDSFIHPKHLTWENDIQEVFNLIEGRTSGKIIKELKAERHWRHKLNPTGSESGKGYGEGGDGGGGGDGDGGGD